MREQDKMEQGFCLHLAQTIRWLEMVIREHHITSRKWGHGSFVKKNEKNIIH